MKVFLSYSQQEKVLAQQLADELTEAGVAVRQSEGSKLAGKDRTKRASSALESSDAMIVLVSPSSARSSTVQRDIGFALSSPRYRNRLLPVVVRETAEMPWILNRLKPIRPGRSRRGLGRTILKKLNVK